MPYNSLPRSRALFKHFFICSISSMDLASVMTPCLSSSSPFSDIPQIIQLALRCQLHLTILRLPMCSASSALTSSRLAGLLIVCSLFASMAPSRPAFHFLPLPNVQDNPPTLGSVAPRPFVLAVSDVTSNSLSYVQCHMCFRVGYFLGRTSKFA